MQEFDLIVIGAGPGGYVGAIRAAQLGLKTAVVEKSKTLGGVCLNVGCIPSKALLESSEHYEFARQEAREHGVLLKGLKLDLNQMMRRKEQIVSRLTKGIEFLFKKNKITKFHGWGRLKSPTEAEISLKGGETEILKGKNILLAAGSLPVELPFAKFDGETLVSSTEALSFSKVPEKLAVIGGGYIGLELGSVWNRLGSEVTVIEAANSICPASDKDIREQLLKHLQKQGIKFRLGCRVQKAESQDGKALVSFEGAQGKTMSLKSSKALVCAGRRPRTENLGLEALGIKIAKGGQVEVNGRFQTACPNIFAIGDMIRGPMLAHKAEEEGVAAAEFIATGGGHVNYGAIPEIVYTNPEAASVGKTEDELISQNIPYKKGMFPFEANGRAKSLGLTSGFVKILAHAKSDKILGAHILGPRAGELIAEVIVAMEFHGSSEDLARCAHAHPTLSEAVREAALAVSQRARQM